MISRWKIDESVQPSTQNTQLPVQKSESDAKFHPFQVPEDIYKSHLENVRSYGPSNVDSARQNLAASFVNG